MACKPVPNAVTNAVPASNPSDEKTNPADAAAPKAPTKISVIIDLLRRQQGARLADIAGITGWRPHTARAALTGLKKGHAIESGRMDKQTTYVLA